MKTLFHLMIISICLMLAAPAFAGSIVSVYNCQQSDSASENDVIAAASDWLKTAKTIKGGENLEVRVMFPVAAVMGDNDFMFVVIAPSFVEYGVFMENFSTHETADDDKKYADLVNCNDSAMWESFKG
jgi:hypothetical protein